MVEREEGLFVGHSSCPHCSSSDANAIYYKEVDGNPKYDSFCWSCKTWTGHNTLVDYGLVDADRRYSYEEEYTLSEADLEMLDKIRALPTRGWKERKIKLDTYKFYGCRAEEDSDGNPIWFYYPYTVDGEVTGYKKRHYNKVTDENGKSSRPQATVGCVKMRDAELFGQSNFDAGGKFLIITEGEDDCLAYYQTLHDNSGGKYKTAVVSVGFGAGNAAKHVKTNYRWVTSFQHVLIAFDNDKQGKEAADEVLALLKPGQGYRIKFKQFKDASDYVRNRKERELVEYFWNKEPFSPAGVVGSSQTFEAMIERASYIKIPLPPFARKLQDMMNGGLALGEITTLAAASSVGKTSITNEWVYHFVFNSPYKVGIISLESDVGELTENLLSLHIGKKLANMTDEEKLEFYKSDAARQAHAELTTAEDGSDRYYVLNHQGAVVDNDLMKNIEYLVKVLGCKVIILDPLTLALSGKQNDGMDIFMSDLLRFVKREQVHHINVVHVRKNSNGAKANSTGAEIAEEDIKGSGALFQVSMNNILLMRDKTNPDPKVRNTTKVVCSKARRTGNTGPAGFWFYDNETARLSEGQDPHGEYAADEEILKEFGAFNQPVTELDY